MSIYIEPRDWWIGYYRGDTHHYVCLLPTVVIRWPRRYVNLIAAITALRDRARDPKHGGKVTVHETTAPPPEEHR